MADITYESICKKLGFDVDTYVSPIGDTEDDGIDDPLRREFISVNISDLL